MIKELEESSEYRDFDLENIGNYEKVQFVYDKDWVTMIKKQGYNRRKGISFESFNDEWECELPKEVVTIMILKLLENGSVTLKDLQISETYSYNNSDDIHPEKITRNYTTNLELILRQDQKPIIELQNPKEYDIQKKDK